MKTLGNRIATARAAKGWGQKQLAEQFGCKPEQISMWEIGKRNPRPKAVAALADALSVRYEWLSNGEGPMWVEGAAENSNPYFADENYSPAKRILRRAVEADLNRILADLTDDQAEAWFVEYQKTMDKMK